MHLEINYKLKTVLQFHPIRDSVEIIEIGLVITDEYYKFSQMKGGEEGRRLKRR